MNALLLLPLTVATVISTPGDFSAAQKQALATHRLVLIDFFTTWCSTCHDMDAKVYARSDVAQFLGEHFVLLRGDAEAGEGKLLADRFHVVGYPTLVMADPESGEEIDRLMGFFEGKEFLARLSDFQNHKGTLAELELDIAIRHALRGDRRAVWEVKDIVARDPHNDQQRAAKALWTLGKYYYLRGEHNYSRAEETLRYLQSHFAASEEAKQAPVQIALCQHGVGNDRAAQATLDAYLAADPVDMERYSSYAWAAYKNNFARPRAVEVAKRGLELDPNLDGLWDTLAELHGADGDRKGAQECERKAIAIKPNERYYREQLQRFGGK